MSDRGSPSQQHSEPTRLVDDPAAPSAMRDALRVAGEASTGAHPFDLDAGASRLTQTLGRLKVAKILGGVLGALLMATASFWILSPSASPERPPHASHARTANAPAPNAPARAPVEAATPTHELAPSPPVRASAPPPSSEPPEAASAGPGAEVTPVEPAAASPGSRSHAATPPREHSAGASHAADDALAREMRAVAEARRSLESDPAAALAALDRVRTGSSVVFREERDALTVLALVATGRRAQAFGLGERFVAAHPAGPFTERVRRALAGPGTP